MKKTLYASLILLALTFAVFSQKLGKPTLTATVPTTEQRKKIDEGIVLHDAKKYEEAIAKYNAVLAESPDCTAAMYELAYSLHAKGSKLEAVEVANKGTRYISDELPLFYVFMANNLDDLGKSADAIKIYTDGLKFLEGNPNFGGYRSILHFNLGITHIRLKNLSEARKSLKNAVENNFSYSSPNFQLAYVFSVTNYKIPAFLAACRFVSLEYNTNRTKPAVSAIMSTLKPPGKDPKSGNTVINLDFGGPTDEGDFGTVDMHLPMMLVSKDEKDKAKAKTDNEVFIEALDTAIGLLASDKKLASTFVGRTYVPFMVDMKRSGNLEAFAYMVLSLSGKQDVSPWLDANEAKLKSMIAWAKDYRLPVK